MTANVPSGLTRSGSKGSLRPFGLSSSAASTPDSMSSGRNESGMFNSTSHGLPTVGRRAAASRSS